MTLVSSAADWLAMYIGSFRQLDSTASHTTLEAWARPRHWGGVWKSGLRNYWIPSPHQLVQAVDSCHNAPNLPIWRWYFTARRCQYRSGVCEVILRASCRTIVRGCVIVVIVLTVVKRCRRRWSWNEHRNGVNRNGKITSDIYDKWNMRCLMHCQRPAAVSTTTTRLLRWSVAAFTNICSNTVCSCWRQFDRGIPCSHLPNVLLPFRPCLLAIVVDSFSHSDQHGAFPFTVL